VPRKISVPYVCVACNQNWLYHCSHSRHFQGTFKDFSRHFQGTFKALSRWKCLAGNRVWLWTSVSVPKSLQNDCPPCSTMHICSWNVQAPWIAHFGACQFFDIHIWVWVAARQRTCGQCRWYLLQASTIAFKLAVCVCLCVCDECTRQPGSALVGSAGGICYKPPP